MIVLPMIFLLVPVLSKYKTEPHTTTTVLPSSRVPHWGHKVCDTLKYCPYRLESYIRQETGMVFCIDSKNSTIKSVTLFSSIYCESLRQFNATVSQKIATSLQKFFNDEKAGSEKSVTLKDKECPFVIFEPWITYCFDRKKYLKYVMLEGDLKLDSQEAYRLKIYLAAFL